jgi:predicted choloylglycine hydrolase
MADEYELVNKDFLHVVVEGTAYEVGYQQGEILKESNPGMAEWFTSGKVEPEKMGCADFLELQKLFEGYCPGITDEIQGLADGFGVKAEVLQIYNPPIYQPGNCSQIALLSTATADNHVYVARSYEYHKDMNDFRLCGVRINDKASSLGFTEFLLGRDDGMNEHGLCVTFSGGGTFNRQPTRRGLNFFLVVRTLLDNCKTVDEALAFIEGIPIAEFWNFLITDKDDHAALVQCFDGEIAVSRIDRDSPVGYLFSTNHYVLPEMVRYQEFAGEWILKNSKARYALIEKTLSTKAPAVGKEDLRALLSKEIYDGVSGHYYTDFFGTLFSVIYDLSEGKMEVCFGAPTHNEWRPPFSLDDPVGVRDYTAVFPDKTIHVDRYIEKPQAEGEDLER